MNYVGKNDKIETGFHWTIFDLITFARLVAFNNILNVEVEWNQLTKQRHSDLRLSSIKSPLTE